MRFRRALRPALVERRNVQQAKTQAVEDRMRPFREKLPDTDKFQKYADANQAFLAYRKLRGGQAY